MQTKKTNKNVVIAVICVIAVAVVGIAAWALNRDPPAPQYITAVAKVADVEDAVLATGSLQPAEVVNVASTVQGTVMTVEVITGQLVEKGQLLATIESNQLRSNVRQAENGIRQAEQSIESAKYNLQNQEQNMARQEQLKERNVWVPQTYEGVVNQLRNARISLQTAESNLDNRVLELESALNALDKSNIRAPMTGVVAEITAPVGSGVNPNNQNTGGTVVKMAKMDRMAVRAQVSEADIIRIRAGQKVYFTILGDPKKRYYAELLKTELTPANGVLDPTGRNPISGAVYYNALFEVPNDDGRLLPAMTAEVHVVLNEAKGVLTIPSTALGPKGADGRNEVRVLKGDQVEVRKVLIGINNNFEAEVKSGNLKAGEQVITGEAGATTTAAASGSKPLFGGSPVQQP